MRLLELRLIEDHRSTLRFPANFTVVAGLSTAARTWLVDALPELLSGVECGASAFVEIDGMPREIGPGALAQRVLRTSVDGAVPNIVLTREPFDQAIARIDQAHLAAANVPVVVHAEQVDRAQAAYEATLASVQVLERAVELCSAEHRGSLVAAEDLGRSITDAKAGVDPIAGTVRDRAIENAARIEVETGAPPGVCRAESESAAKARVARLETALFEIDSALQVVRPVDTAAVEQAIDIVRVVTATGPIPVPEAVQLATDYRALRTQIAELEERIASDEGGMLVVKDRLDHARSQLAAAEAKLQPTTTNTEDIAALEQAHDAVLEAGKRASGLFGSRAKKVLEDALAEEQVWLDKLGYPTWSSFIMGARMLDSTAENKRRLEIARKELEETERVWSRVMAKLDHHPEFHALLDRLERLQEAAHAIVGDVDDVEDALMSLRVDPGPPAMSVEDARSNLIACLTDVGFGLEADATLDDLLAAARVWLADVREIQWLHNHLETDMRLCSQQLDDARANLETVQLLGSVDEIEGFGSEQLRAAREAISRAEANVWANREALLRIAQLIEESERLLELEAHLAIEVEKKSELLDISRQVAAAAGDKFEQLAAAFRDGEALVQTDLLADDMYDADAYDDEPVRASQDEASVEIPDRLDALSAIIDDRITTLRDAGVDGAVPLIIDDAFVDLPAEERAELLGWLEGYSLFLQVIYLTNNHDVVAWVEGRAHARAASITGTGFFA